jgi:hypothetical protein
LNFYLWLDVPLSRSRRRDCSWDVWWMRRYLVVDTCMYRVQAACQRGSHTTTLHLETFSNLNGYYFKMYISLLKYLIIIHPWLSASISKDNLVYNMIILYHFSRRKSYSYNITYLYMARWLIKKKGVNLAEKNSCVIYNNSSTE